MLRPVSQVVPCGHQTSTAQHRDGRRPVCEQKHPCYQGGADKDVPFHRSTAARKTTASSRASATEGVVNDLVHSGFWVPSLIRRRISCNWWRESESSQACLLYTSPS